MPSQKAWLVDGQGRVLVETYVSTGVPGHETPLGRFEVLEKLRIDPVTQAIPVIMLTGLSEKAKIQNAIDLGTNYYIVKPFDVPDLFGNGFSVTEKPLGTGDIEKGLVDG